MSELKKTILTEMDKRGWNPTDLARASKVPQPTIQRFLKGGHNEPRTPTLIKIAAAFGMTDLQLRGGYIDGEVPHREIPIPETLIEQRPPVIEELQWKALPPKARALVEELMIKTSSGTLKDNHISALQTMVDALSKEDDD